MVTYKLVQAHPQKLEYAYYPEGKEDRTPGVIIADLANTHVFVEKTAEDDKKIVLRTVGELNAMRESENQRRRKKGKPELTEEEWPTEMKPQTRWEYADMAVMDIFQKINDDAIPDVGRVK